MLKARAGVLTAFSLVLLFTLGNRCHGEQKAAPPPAKTPERYLHDPQMQETLVDLFPGMDGPNPNLTAEEIRGRIVWNLWTGDSYRMWDFLAKNGFGTSDLLKTIDSRGRDTRFARVGMINQPGFQSAPGPDRYGLFLDVPKP